MAGWPSDGGGVWGGASPSGAGPGDLAAQNGAAPKRSRRSRLPVVVGLLIAIVAVIILGLMFLGAQVETLLRGTVEFGTDTSGCAVQGRGSSFSAGSPVAAVAHLSREVPAGTAVTLRILQDGRETASAPKTFDVTGDCLASTFPGILEPAHYRIEYLDGQELLAAGEFDVAAPSSGGVTGNATSPSPAPATPAGTPACFNAASGGEPLPSEDAALERRLPDTFEGARLCKGSFRGETILGSPPSDADLALLTGFGKEVDDYTMAMAIVSPLDSEAAASPVSFGAIRLAGVDGSRLLTAYVKASFKAGNARQASLGGKDVTIASSGGTTVYLYAGEDVVFMVLAPDKASAAKALAALP